MGSGLERGGERMKRFTVYGVQTLPDGTVELIGGDGRTVLSIRRESEGRWSSASFHVVTDMADGIHAVPVSDVPKYGDGAIAF